MPPSRRGWVGRPGLRTSPFCRCAPRRFAIGFDVVTARAVASLAVLVEYAAPLLVDGGQLVAWKGARDEAEELGGEEAGRVVGLSPDRVVQVEPFPGAHSRHLHFYVKTGPDARPLPPPARHGQQAPASALNAVGRVGGRR